MNARNTNDTAFVSTEVVGEYIGDAQPRLIVEASELQWPPEYSPQIVVVERPRSMTGQFRPLFGNGQPFFLEAVDGEGTRIYHQMLGTWQLHVLND